MMRRYATPRRNRNTPHPPHPESGAPVSSQRREKGETLDETVRRSKCGFAGRPGPHTPQVQLAHDTHPACQVGVGGIAVAWHGRGEQQQQQAVEVEVVVVQNLPPTIKRRSGRAWGNVGNDKDEGGKWGKSIQERNRSDGGNDARLHLS